MEGGTTFHFVTDGFDAAYAEASRAAGEGGVDIAGGASAVRQALVAGVVDERLVRARVEERQASARRSAARSCAPNTTRLRVAT